jgi:hypothetical protein
MLGRGRHGVIGDRKNVECVKHTRVSSLAMGWYLWGMAGEEKTRNNARHDCHLWKTDPEFCIMWVKSKLPAILHFSPLVMNLALYLCCCFDCDSIFVAINDRESCTELQTNCQPSFLKMLLSPNHRMTSLVDD